MYDINSNVMRLNAAQVSALLALGLLPSFARAASDVLDLLRAAVVESEGTTQRRLLAELQGPVLSADAGPLAPQGLVPELVAAADLYRGQSLWDVLTGSQTRRSVLRSLAHYGEILSGESFLPMTRITGGVISALARSNLALRHVLPFQPAALASTVALLEELSRAPNLPDWLCDHAGRTAGALTSLGS